MERASRLKTKESTLEEAKRLAHRIEQNILSAAQALAVLEELYFW